MSSEWTKTDVSKWLREQVGLAEYCASFEDNDITGKELITLNAQDLKDLNVEKIGHRKRIEQAIEALKSNTTVVSAPSTPTKKRNISEVTQSPQKEHKRVRIQTPPPVASNETAMCTICFEDKDTIYPLRNCKSKGSFCLECLHSYLDDKLNTRTIPILCPDSTCRHEITDDLEVLLSKEQMERFQQIGLDSLVSSLSTPSSGKSTNSINTPMDLVFPSSTKFLHCPTPNCKYIFAIDETDKDEESYHLRCDICAQHYCLKCKVKFHFGKSCLAYKKHKLQTANHDEIATMAFIQSLKIKSCPKCGSFVERDSGCAHMICVCGEQFCYMCGKSQSLCTCGDRAFDADMNRDSQN